MALTLSGCGSSATLATTTSSSGGLSAASPVVTTPPAAPATTTSAPTVSYPERLISTSTSSGGGTGYTVTYKVSRLLYGKNNQTPPTAVLTACSDYTSNIPTDAYFEGSLTFVYTHGALPMQLYVTPGAPLESINTQVAANPISDFAIMANGSWVCPAIDDENGGGGTSFTVQPHQSLTLPFWVIINQAISNAAPTIPQSQLDVLSFGIGLQPNQGSDITATASGPQVTTCDHTSYMLPYAQLPLPNGDCPPAY